MATRGSLIIIGGHEDKIGEKQILRTIAEKAGTSRLVVRDCSNIHVHTLSHVLSHVLSAKESFDLRERELSQVAK